MEREKTVILFADTIPPRLRYITDFIGREISGEPFKLIYDKTEFKNFQGPKINYSREGIDATEFHVYPHSLLFEKNIRQQTIECFEYGKQKAFFPTAGDFPFDIFAASFYLLSRYEEYLPYEPDMYGRYPHEISLAFREGFLQIPLVNDWLKNFVETIKRKFPSFTPGSYRDHHSPFIFLPTYDIDEAYSFKYKPWWRNAGGAIKDLLKNNWKRFRLRRDVLNGKADDPFDSFNWLDELHQQHKINPRYFFLLAEKSGRYDKNILPSESAIHALVKRHSDKFSTGIHPSWQSGDDPELLMQEINTMGKITGKNITVSRQHYIRFKLPHTFRQLIDAGISEDFSMGYGSINGFRASVASPFLWYDLEKEMQTSLLLYPFCFMEANAFYEQRIKPAEALEEMRHYYREIKNVNGTMVTIWHNTFLGTDPLYRGWKEIYLAFISEIN